MNRSRRSERLGGLVVSAVALAPFAWLWVLQVRGAPEPPSLRVRLDMAIWMAVFAVPWAVAARLLWRTWWRRASNRLATVDGPALLLAAAAATLPEDRRDWGAAMTAELAQVQDRAARWRFALGAARAAVFPPRRSRTSVLVTGVLAVVAVVAAALATGAALPAGRVFAPTFVGLVGGLATLTVARSRAVRLGGPGLGIAALGLAGVAGCIAATIYYLIEYPSYDRARPPQGTLASLPPVTAVVLAVGLAGCLWLALATPRWLRASRHARRFGAAMALVLVAGFVLAARQDHGGVNQDSVVSYLLSVPMLVLLTGSALAAAAGRSFRAGLGACALALALGAPPIVAAWLAEALRVYGLGGGMLLDGEGSLGVGANLGNAVWWPLIFLALWALPVGIIGAAAGSWRARRRGAHQHADAVPTV